MQLCCTVSWGIWSKSHKHLNMCLCYVTWPGPAIFMWHSLGFNGKFMGNSSCDTVPHQGVLNDKHTWAYGPGMLVVGGVVPCLQVLHQKLYELKQ